MLKALRNLFERILTLFTVTLLAGLAVVVLYGVTCRKLNIPLVWYDEGASIMLAWVTYYGAALAALKRSHMGVPTLVNMLPRKLRIAAVLFAEAVVILFFALLGWYGFQVLVILEGDTMVSMPNISTRFTQSVIPIGSALFIIAQLLSLPEILKQARNEGIVDADQKELEEILQK